MVLLDVLRVKDILAFTSNTGYTRVTDANTVRTEFMLKILLSTKIMC